MGKVLDFVLFGPAGPLLVIVATMIVGVAILFPVLAVAFLIA